MWHGVLLSAIVRKKPMTMTLSRAVVRRRRRRRRRRRVSAAAAAAAGRKL
jgi:hypothetical protein